MTLIDLVPSFSSIDPTGFTMSFIRGIGSSTLGAGTFSSVATYIDGVYIARTTNALFEFDGAESLQVLAGPQGALYGRNATAGAVVTDAPKTAEPGSELTGTLTRGWAITTVRIGWPISMAASVKVGLSI